MRPLIISLGNRFHRDDSAGARVLDQLRQRLNGNADYLENPGDITQLLDLWRNRDSVYLIDACFSAQQPAGSITRLDALHEPLPKGFTPASSHSLSLDQAIQLGALLRLLPRQLIIYAISGKYFSTGTTIDEGVAEAVTQVAENIVGELALERLDHA